MDPGALLVGLCLVEPAVTGSAVPTRPRSPRPRGLRRRHSAPLPCTRTPRHAGCRHGSRSSTDVVAPAVGPPVLPLARVPVVAVSSVIPRLRQALPNQRQTGVAAGGLHVAQQTAVGVRVADGGRVDQTSGMCGHSGGQALLTLEPRLSLRRQRGDLGRDVHTSSDEGLVTGWLLRADQAIDARNGFLHATPLLSMQGRGDIAPRPVRHALGEMTWKTRTYVERPLTVEACGRFTISSLELGTAGSR